MLDIFKRKINYLRISVTDKCNLRCHYCMPDGEIQLLPRWEILSLEEIIEVARVAVDMGIDKVRLTGGEPLVRRNIIGLVAGIAQLEGIRNFGMSTNGILLREYAHQLADAGLHRVNVSLDATSPEKYAEITRGGDVSRVFAGIDAAIDAGLTPVKINCVVEHSSQEKDALDVALFGREKGLKVRYIRQMTPEKGEFWPVQGGDGGHCLTCNRLRLSSNGMIRPCLFSDIGYSVREFGIRRAIEMAIAAKPASGRVSNNKFYEIGG
ncbi:MAG: radical SAM protein [Deltaproteobacteria bacterium]|nr:radical SAM protein [Deltaproteobacteria bacterium]